MKGFKIRLELNNKQATLAAKHAGVARHAYNWGLAVCKNAYENKEKRPSAIDLHKKLVAQVKKENPWYYQVSKCSPQEALRNLEKAYIKSFKEKKGLPVFKKKGTKDSFYLEGNIFIENNIIKLPKFGKVKISESLRMQAVKNVTISKIADQWFVSFKAPHENLPKQTQNNPVGVDLGIKTLATLSNETVFENPRPYKKLKRKLKLAQRKLSKKYKKGVPQSQNYKKAQKKVAKIHYKIACIRKDALHKLTTRLAKNHSEIVIEDLNVSGMSKNHKLASAILDGGFYEFRRQLSYKCEWYGSVLTVVDRFYPSSKTCSACGTIKKDLKLSERTFECSYCKNSLDRDLNAALNLRNKAVSYTVGPLGMGRPIGPLRSTWSN
jgi:putative transposase